MTNKELGLLKIQQLVNRFNEQLSSYKKSDYNEAKTRIDFIDPFFKALGWDMENEQGFAESYREVIHEDKVKIGKATKAPDYSFRLGGGQRLFFVEAKKPSIVIKDDIQPAYQVRRYGWSAKLNISLITDFEEFSIYDCTKKPNPSDKTSVARVKYITFNEYEKEWDFLWNTFSKESILKGGFDKFIGTTANKKGTATVDKEFLESLDNWRTLLAENITKGSVKLNEDELNFVVQHTLDRIIFLRICEDRSIEPYGKLQDIFKSPDYYKSLLREFKEADDKYNSGIFNLQKDTLSSEISIDNRTLKTIINQLYYPESPYEFSVLSVEILGSAYEQFLGKTITINSRGKAVIEQKPEVRKAGGVYYTPQYIVDSIVSNTLGLLIKNKTPKEVSEIKIVDPACGSGSFLLGAYQYLLNWHKDYYIENPSGKNNTLTSDGNLTTYEKKRILLNNIFGVDLDVNAVEVSKLSLLLKCMEGETQASVANQISLFNDRVLPTLDYNIKSGNSLIELDYYDNEFDFGEEKIVKPFSWSKSFPEVFKAGGFDVVIGNPPYIDSEEMTKTNITLRNYALAKFESAKGNWDMYCIYTEKAISLLKQNGKLGFIIPNKFLSAPYGIHLKKYLSQYQVIRIDDYTSVSVFISDRKINVYPIILIIDKNEKKKDGIYSKFIESNSVIIKTHETEYEIFKDDINWTAKFSISNVLIEKVLSKSKLLKNYFEIQNSATVNEAYLIKEILEDDKDGELRLINTGTIDRYSNLWGISKTQYIKEKYQYPTMKKRDFEKSFPNRVNSTYQEKIVLAGMVKNLEATLLNNEYYTAKSTTIILKSENCKYKSEYLLGLLNSKLYSFIYKEINKHNAMSGGFMNVSQKQLKDFIFYEIDFKNKIEISSYEQIVSNVEQLLILNKEIQTISLETNRERLITKIQYHDDKINEIVYALYDLNEIDIGFIEKN
jgi:hypothetical protein